MWMLPDSNSLANRIAVSTLSINTPAASPYLVSFASAQVLQHAHKRLASCLTKWPVLWLLRAFSAGNWSNLIN